MGGSTGTQPTQPMSSTATPAQALASVATNKGMQPSSPTATNHYKTHKLLIELAHKILAEH